MSHNNKNKRLKNEYSDVEAFHPATLVVVFICIKFYVKCKIERRKWLCKRGRKLKQQLNSPKTLQSDSFGNGAFTSHLAGPIAESLTPCFFHRKDMNGILKEMSFSLWEQQYLRRNSRNFSNNNIKRRFSADRTTVIWTSAKAQNQRLGRPMYL